MKLTFLGVHGETFLVHAPRDDLRRRGWNANVPAWRQTVELA